MGLFMGVFCGVALNDSNYPVKKVVLKTKFKDERDLCPFYLKWQSMIYRCYGAKSSHKYPSYVDCTVCEEWLTFSNFKAWMEKQDWEGNDLDKDLLVNGNKIYSPDHCVFISSSVNAFLIDRSRDRGDFPIGVYFDSGSMKFKSQISNQFTKKRENLGRYTSPEEAHLAWKKRKHELACQLAELQTDERVANALRTRYL